MKTLVRCIDRPCGVVVTVDYPVPTEEKRSFTHDDVFAYSEKRHSETSERHKEALREAAAYASLLSERHRCGFQTNF